MTTSVQVSLMEPDDEEDYSIPNPVEAPQMSEEEARQESYREEADDDEDIESEDYPIQLRCVLEIKNTGAQPGALRLCVGPQV